MGYQSGGWTITWQGSSGDITPGTTIKEAIQQVVPGATVTYSADGYGAEGADIGIAVIGETPYAEGYGDGKVNLDQIDIDAVRNLKSSGIPVVVILISGRPIILNPILHYCDALIAAWLPGTEGEGITDVLFGDYQPVGSLSQTWPRDASQIPINIDDAVYNPLFKYGDGITSLNDSPAGSSPEVYSANVATIQSIEISFNKKMDAPSIAPAGFSVFANSSTPINITNLSVQSYDSTTFILALGDSIRKTNTYTISYTPGTIQSQDSGQLAAFENVPIYNLLSNYQYIHAAPDKIEAEEYIRMKGVSTTTCSDEGGGKAISNIQAGDWTEYYVNVSQTGTYSLEYRIGSITDTGRIELIAKGISVSVFNLPNTGSLNTWQTASTVVHLSEGPQTIRMYAAGGGFQLNWIRLSISTGVGNNGEGIVKEFRLSQNYPNPFNPSTTITYQVSGNSWVTVKIFDILGREVAALLNEEKPAGTYSIQWDASNMSSGVYFYRFHAGSFMETKRMTLLK
jgi:hypothetical protein